MNIEESRIFLGGISVEDLAQTYGTPTYVYDASRIRANYRRVQEAFRQHDPSVELFYAIKACDNLSIARILVDLGCGIDAASPNEIGLAQMLGVSPNKTMFSGNYVADEDLKYAYQSGAIINLDDIGSLARLLKFGRPDLLSFRVNLGFRLSNVGDSVKNAGPNAKFGLDPADVVEAYRRAQQAGIKRFGVHMMPGSCVTDTCYFGTMTGYLMDIMASVKKTLGIDFEFADVGGGLGIPYRDDESALQLGAAAKQIVDTVNSKCNAYGMQRPKLFMEPGRYFVGDAGYVIGRVHSIKEDSSGRILGTDVSMNVFARPILYDAYHRIYINGREGDPTVPAGLCGQVCENTDYWCRDRDLPGTAEEGNVIVVRDAGAYGYGMSYAYNGRLRPAEVLIDGAEHSLIRHRENFHDMIGNMVLPKLMTERASSIDVP